MSRADRRRSTSRWPPTARRASGRSPSSPTTCSTDVDTLAARAAPLPRRRRCARPGRDRRGLLPDRAGRRRQSSGCCSPTSPPPTSGSSPARPSTTSACPTPEDEDDQVPAGDLDLARRPRHARHGHGASCSTTSTSTPTRCSPTWPRRLGLRRARSTRLVGLTSRVSRPLADAAVSDDARCAPPSTRRAPRSSPATYRSARSCSTPTATVIGRGHNVRERDGDPTGHAEVVALRAAAAARRRVAADRLHPRGHPRAVHDVRRRARAVARSTASSSGRTTTRPAPSARSGTSSATAGSTTAPRWSAGCSPTSAASPAGRFLRPPSASGSLSRRWRVRAA